MTDRIVISPIKGKIKSSLNHTQFRQFDMESLLMQKIMSSDSKHHDLGVSISSKVIPKIANN